jgi:hypothetical protein
MTAGPCGHMKCTRRECTDCYPACGECGFADPSHKLNCARAHRYPSTTTTTTTLPDEVLISAMVRSVICDPPQSAVKSRPDLLPPAALLAAGMSMAGRTDRDEGSDMGYMTIQASKYRASLLRHVLAYLGGETVDADSGLSPLAHVISNAAILFAKDND